MIVQVIGTLRGGGAERVALTLHKGLKELGERSKILVLSDKIDYTIEDEDIVLGADIEQIEADMIIAHMQDVSEKLVDRYPNIWHVIHSSYSYRFQRRGLFSRFKYQRRFRKLYDNQQLICVSEGVKQDVLHHLQVKPKAIEVIYNPFDIEEIQKEAVEDLDLGFKYMINIAAFTKVKNQALLLASYAKLETELDLVLLGKGSQEKRYKRMAEELGIGDRVHFPGWQSNPYKYLKNAELFVLSSDVEGFGNVLVESLIVNTPVVSTDCPSGPDEILVGALRPFLAKVGDRDDLSEKMALALKAYPDIERKYYDKFNYMEIADHYRKLK